MLMLTTKEFAAKLKVEYIVAFALLKFLVSKKIAKPAGTRPNPEGQRGKPARLFEVPTGDVSLSFLTLNAKKAPNAVDAAPVKKKPTPIGKSGKMVAPGGLFA